MFHKPTTGLKYGAGLSSAKDHHASTTVPTKSSEKIITYEHVKIGKNGEKQVHVRKYVKGGCLGKGGFAKCYEVTHKTSGRKYAAKIIDKKTLTKAKTKQKLASEIKIHQSLSHQYVVRFYHCFEDSQFVYIILELCECRSMMELMKRKKRLSEDETRFFMHQLLTAVQYMHTNRVIHRDLKLGNIFLNRDMDLKIGDFGLAAQLDYDGQRKRTICGTPNYIAPEILQNLGHSYEVDIWSIGVILFTFLVGTPPFETTNVKTTYSRIKGCKYSFPSNANLSAQAQDLIRQILTNDPTSRPTIPDILSHPFFNSGPPCNICPDSLLEYSSHYVKKSETRNPLGQIQNTMKPPVSTKSKSSSKKHLHNQENDPHFLQKENRKVPTIDTANLVKDSSAPTSDITRRTGLTTRRSSTTASKNAPVEQQGNKRESQKNNDEDENNLTNMHNNLTVSFAANTGNKMDEDSIENAPQPPQVWVSQWCDFSNKYGLAYKLSNSLTGAHYNDSSKMLWNSQTDNVDYIERLKTPAGHKDEIKGYRIDQHPTTLQKKITLIKYFHNFFQKKQGAEEAENMMVDVENNEICDEVIYVKRWLKTRHAVIFRLSNRTVQVCFLDDTEIILSSEARLVTYTDKEGNKKTFTLSSIVKQPQPDVAKRLKYTKDILYQLINRQK